MTTLRLAYCTVLNSLLLFGPLCVQMFINSRGQL